MNLSITQKLLVTYVLAILMLTTIAIVSVVFQISVPTFTRDVTAIARLHPLAGILSNLGVFLWCISASICFFSAMILRPINQAKSFSFLFSSAILSTYLMLDDAFLFHEYLAFQFFNINEKVVFMILGLTVLAYLILFMNVILKTKYRILLLALTFLALSVVSDTFFEPWLNQFDQWSFFIEDGFKWLGIVSWCFYYVNTSYHFVQHAYEAP